MLQKVVKPGLVSSESVNKRQYEDLEDKNHLLQSEIENLKNENLALKEQLKELNKLKINKENLHRLPQSTSLSRIISFKTEEKFCYEQLPKMLQEQPTNVRFTLLDRALDKIGVYGSERIKAIKDAFRFIIDNVCPIEAKGLFS